MNARKMRVAMALAVLLVSGMAQADVLNMGGTRDGNGTWTGLASLETVPVGNPGNAGELSGSGADGGYGPNRVCGAVSYTYKIGKYEVTAGQYTAFLNAVAKTDTYGLYNTSMDTAVFPYYGCNIKRSGDSGSYTYSVASDWANRPVHYVSWGDSARFANWLHNNQPTGAQGLTTTEDGAYYLNGATSNAALLAVSRKSDWKWAITSEDEWYKAAYYKGGSTNAGYWDYPTSSDGLPSNDLTTPDGGNNANFEQNGYTIGSPYYRTPVGEFELSDSPYGTFDQGGNVWEWTEAILYGSERGFRGGSFGDGHLYDVGLLASYRYSIPTFESLSIGFRVSGVPEQHPGDANYDGFVNVGDLGILSGNWGGSGKTWAQGDFTGDGLVNVSDLGMLSGNWGWTGGGGGTQQVPEPATLGLLAMGGLAMLRRRR